MTHSVYKKMGDQAKYSDGKNMWTSTRVTMAGEAWDCFKSTWLWGP